ncbi:MAG: hypothetical protein ACMV1B_10635 [Prevotella sp.]
MFFKTADERLSAWLELRKKLTQAEDPLAQVVEFWAEAPLIIHNHKINPHNPKSWPTPWEIINENKYDDFTIALMIGYTLKLSDRFKNETIEVRTMVDSAKTKLYNLVYVGNEVVLNYDRFKTTSPVEVDADLYVENVVSVIYPR